MSNLKLVGRFAIVKEQRSYFHAGKIVSIRDIKENTVHNNCLTGKSYGSYDCIVCLDKTAAAGRGFFDFLSNLDLLDEFDSDVLNLIPCAKGCEYIPEKHFYVVGSQNKVSQVVKPEKIELKIPDQIVLDPHFDLLTKAKYYGFSNLDHFNKHKIQFEK